MDSLPVTDSEETQLRGYLGSIIRNTETDNRRLAFDLHDGPVQLMVASFQHLQAAQAWRDRDPALEHKELQQGILILRQAINEARRLINELRPAGLDELGLAQALRLYTAQIAVDSGVDIHLDISDDWPQLSSDLETSLFRIIQEAISNARKYANSPSMAVTLKTLPEKLLVTIRDWGCGFCPEDVKTDLPGSHIGLIAIRERTRMMGGTCVVLSDPGQGTTIRIEFPHSKGNPESGAEPSA